MRYSQHLDSIQREFNARECGVNVYMYALLLALPASRGTHTPPPTSFVHYAIYHAHRLVPNVYLPYVCICAHTAPSVGFVGEILSRSRDVTIIGLVRGDISYQAVPCGPTLLRMMECLMLHMQRQHGYI